MAPEPRACCLCHRVEPSGGLRLTLDLDDWYCRDEVACITAQDPEPTIPSGYEAPSRTAAAIDADWEARRARARRARGRRHG